MIPTHEPDPHFRQAILGAVAIHLLVLGVVLPLRPPEPPPEPTKSDPHWVLPWTPDVAQPDPPTPPPPPPSPMDSRLILPDDDADSPPDPIREFETHAEAGLPALTAGPPIYGRPQGPPSPRPFRVGTSGIEAPSRIHHVLPDYPLQARKIDLEGLVVLDVLLDEKGRVAEIEVVRGQRLGLTEAAVEAVGRWVYEPARMDGRPVPVRMQVRVRFELD